MVSRRHIRSRCVFRGEFPSNHLPLKRTLERSTVHVRYIIATIYSRTGRTSFMLGSLAALRRTDHYTVCRWSSRKPLWLTSPDVDCGSTIVLLSTSWPSAISVIITVSFVLLLDR